MILCAVCKYWQHGICFLIKDEDEAPQAHFCDVCSEVCSIFVFLISLRNKDLKIKRAVTSTIQIHET